MNKYLLSVLVLGVLLIAGGWYLYTSHTTGILGAKPAQNEQVPHLHLISVTPDSGTAPLAVTISIATSTLASSTSLAIDFNDRNPFTACEVRAGCFSKPIKHTFILPGTYTVTLMDMSTGTVLDGQVVTVGGVTPPLPKLTWKVGDKIGAFTLTNLSLDKNPPDYSYPAYEGTASFVGTTTVHGTYEQVGDGMGGCTMGDWYFMVDKGDAPKIPVFPTIDPIYPNEPTGGTFCLFSKEGKPLFKVPKGTATIVIANYFLSYVPKDSIGSFAELVTVITDTPQ